MEVVNQIKEAISLITPLDKKEGQHLQFAKKWIDSGVGIFRLEKPATPDPHLYRE